MAKELANLSDDDVLGGISSLDDALKVLANAGINATEIKELGHGFEVLKDKNQLVGVALLILKMDFHKSDEYGDGGEFVSLYVVTEAGSKYIVNDGSTGILAQCQKYAANGITAGLIVRNGFVRSDYETEDGNGKTIKATTYYLSSV